MIVTCGAIEGPWWTVPVDRNVAEIDRPAVTVTPDCRPVVVIVVAGTVEDHEAGNIQQHANPIVLRKRVVLRMRGRHGCNSTQTRGERRRD